jgi:hypothetical protein
MNIRVGIKNIILFIILLKGKKKFMTNEINPKKNKPIIPYLNIL